MKLLWISMFFGGALLAQTATFGLTGCTSSVAPGGNATCSVSISGGANPAMFALRFLTVTGVAAPSVVATGTAQASNKTAQCNQHLCLWGAVNSTTVSNGVVGTATWQIPVNATGMLTFGLSSADVASLAGTGVLSALNPSVSVSVLGSKCDVNGDGLINVADYNATIAQWYIGFAAAFDVNGDGLLTVVDIQRVANAVDGRGCLTT